MSVLGRADDILRHYVGTYYNSEVGEAILNDFRIEFGLDVSSWTITENLDDSDREYHVHIYTQWKEFIYLSVNKKGYVTRYSFVEHVLEDMVPIVTCPLCETGEMDPRAIDNDKALNDEKKTYMYVCDTCPGILVEWFDDSDTEAFARGIR